MFLAVSFAIIAVLVLLMLRCSGLLERRSSRIIAFVLTLAALLLRWLMLYYRSDDFTDFLAKWVEFFRVGGGFAALAEYPGNYNPPYMYLLALFSYFETDCLYLIKVTSTVFDVLLAWACMKTVSLFTEIRSRLLACFFTVLFVPTVMLNGAYWAQCDSIYTFFGVWSIYLALSRRPAASMFALAASLAFKLQAVFIMPVFFILLISGRIKFRQLFWFPAAYVLYMLPMLIAGKPLGEVLTIYVSQAGTVGDALNYNAPSLTSVLSGAADAGLFTVAAFVFTFAVFGIAAAKRKALSDLAMLGFAVVLAIGIPYLLPHMHDRYFYPAELLAIALVFAEPVLSPMPVFMELASLHCYCAYFRRQYLVDPKIGGILMLAALLIAVAYTLIGEENKKNKYFEVSS